MPNSKLKIGVKSMGDLDYDQILAAVKKKYPADEAEEKAMECTNLLLDKLKDSDWYPFKIIMVGKYPKVSIMYHTCKLFPSAQTIRNRYYTPVFNLSFSPILFNLPENCTNIVLFCNSIIPRALFNHSFNPHLFVYSSLLYDALFGCDMFRKLLMKNMIS